MSLESMQLGQYRLLRLIGKGGMGEVYLAEDTRIARQVAIKVIQAETTGYPDPIASQEASRLFLREMKVITTLDHPHILPVFDFGETKYNKSTIMYMVMPLRMEGTLNDWLQARSSTDLLSALDVAYLIQQAADALQHAHDLHIIHQDIKPSNFLIRTRPENFNRPDLLLADFGISKITSATATASQTVRGTPTYMAPEQWDGKPVPASDQYALAVMAYLLLTGRPPFQGGPGQIMFQHFSTAPQPPSYYNPRLTPAVDAVILRALAKRPEERYPSISAFAQALQQAAQNTPGYTFYPPTPTPPPPPPTPTPLPPPLPPTPAPQTSRSRVLVIASVSLAFLLVISGVIVFSVSKVNTDNANATSTAVNQSNATATAQVLLAKHATATVIAKLTATAASQQNIYTRVTSGTPALNDPLSSNTNGYGWNEGSQCQFINNVYDITQTASGFFHYCQAVNTNFSNFAFQIDMHIVKGDAGGIIFRSTNTVAFYYFRVESDGFYDLYNEDGKKLNKITSGPSLAIHPGNQSNTLTVIATGNTIYLYVNQQFLTRINDNAYSQGPIGVVAESYGNPTEIAFSNAKVWTL